MTTIPIRVFLKEQIEPEFSIGLTSSNDCLSDKLISEFNHLFNKPRRPFVKEMDAMVYFGVIGSRERLVIMGPLIFKNIDPFILQLFAKQNSIPSVNFQPVRVVPSTLTGTLCLLHYAINEEMLWESDIVEPHTGENTVFIEQNVEFHERDSIRQIDNADSKSFYNQITFMDHIRNGDVEGARAIEVGSAYELPFQFVKTWEKNMEYLVCSAITLATQAAIEGGLYYKKAYDLSAKYLQRLETCKTTNEYVVLNFEMKQEFAAAVNQAKRIPAMKYSEKIKRYISMHLTDPFTLAEIAEYLDKDASYLSRLFKEETGKSIMQEARIQRINNAAELLKKTDFSIQYIAELFCFSSQSHFGLTFKKIYNCTPQEYRVSHGNL